MEQKHLWAGRKLGQQDMEGVGEAANGRQAVEQFLQHRPDILLLDLRMPEMNAIEAMHVILGKAPEARIIVLSTYNLDEDIFRSLKAGAKAYLLKDSPREQLLESIRHWTCVPRVGPYGPHFPSLLIELIQPAVIRYL
jgi:DNA-binding NarL/FixJ family response regulator